ncbi:hypothetical protein SLEP1_g44305 [Rubroshorea leprosula]|uniref:DNA/RNA-binding protein Alba-like domain-containing protein n=1 Tax=Rubroshorea leprosula TaxID=152421 RepID=A0AAV5LGY5_9ROSI|nr:hypothetical protein SLEP1_g44305 [Rubroshorea leprosula]
MDRYQRVEKPRQETPINENEIRVTTQGRMRNYTTYATTLLQIVLKAMGRAINKTGMIAELIKRRIVGLHQNTSISSTNITDTWEPLEEGLLPLETTRHVAVITIILSKKELDTSFAGYVLYPELIGWCFVHHSSTYSSTPQKTTHGQYQPPISADQVKPLIEDDHEREGSPRMRGKGRGGRGRNGVNNNDNNYNNGVVEYNGNGVSVGVEEFMLVETCNKNQVVTMTIGEVTMTIGKQYLLVDVDKGVAEAGAGVVGEAGLRILGHGPVQAAT